MAPGGNQSQDDVGSRSAWTRVHCQKKLGPRAAQTSPVKRHPFVVALTCRLAVQRREGGCTHGIGLRCGLGLLERGGVQLGEIERGLQIDLRVGEVVGGQAGGERAP